MASLSWNPYDLISGYHATSSMGVKRKSSEISVDLSFSPVNQVVGLSSQQELLLFGRADNHIVAGCSTCNKNILSGHAHYRAESGCYYCRTAACIPSYVTHLVNYDASRSELHSKGYTIHRAAICVPQGVTEVEPESKVILFNTGGMDELRGDLKRQSWPLRAGVPQEARLLSAMVSFAAEHYSSYTPAQPVAIDSLPGCDEQQLHFDVDAYSEEVQRLMKQGADMDFPLSMLVACTPGLSKLDVMPFSINNGWDERTETITEYLLPGDVIVFRGDLGHAGSAYQTHNRRSHMYLLPKSWTSQVGAQIYFLNT